MRHAPINVRCPQSKTARLIITFDCPRRCPGCCNTYKQIMAQAVSISDVAELVDFDVICVTGGEPMLLPERTLDVVTQIRQTRPGSLVYLYTALFADAMPRILDAVDGVQYSLHEGATSEDIRGFHQFQDAIEGRKGSYRAYVHPSTESRVCIRPELWRRIVCKHRSWSTEAELLAKQPGGLPPGESLFILNS